MDHLASLMTATNSRPTLQNYFEAIGLDAIKYLDVSLISIWVLDPSLQRMQCAFCVDADDNRDLRGVTLSRDKYPIYFKNIIENISLLIPDVYKDPITRELVDDYFKPNDIHSLLDFVIYKNLQPKAVICCETVGEKRTWKPCDVEYLRGLTVAAGHALDI